MCVIRDTHRWRTTFNIVCLVETDALFRAVHVMRGVVFLCGTIHDFQEERNEVVIEFPVPLDHLKLSFAKLYSHHMVDTARYVPGVPMQGVLHLKRSTTTYIQLIEPGFSEGAFHTSEGIIFDTTHVGCQKFNSATEIQQVRKQRCERK
jgi:hypothetical protein